MSILDNRTLIDDADSTTNWDDLAGAPSGNLNTETFIQGTGSISKKISASVDGMLFDAGAAQDWSNQHFYLWWNTSTAGKLDTKVNGGVRIRFCGATVSDFFEVFVDGSDTYTGGFKMSVIDIETAAAAPDATGGTPPATTAIRYVGVVFDIVGMISGNVDNCFVDAFWRLPQNTPGILVEGQNAGPVDWTWQDIVDAGDVGDPTKAWGTITKADGVIKINTPIRFGANDAVTHGFSDTNQVIAWEDQLVADGFYELEIIGGSGTQSFVAGIRDGTGDASTGQQGWVITAASVGKRWSIVANDPNIDVCEFFGCTFQHGDVFNIANVNTEVRSTLFNDCTQCLQSGSTFQRNVVVAANTPDGVAFLDTNDLGDIKNCSFTFSDGHAIELTATGTFAFVGNKFSGYGAGGTTDAALFNDSGGSVTVNVTEGGDTPTVRNGAGASTTVNNTVTLLLTVRNQVGNVLEGINCRFEELATGTLIAEGATDVNGEFSHQHNYTGDLDTLIIVRNKAFEDFETSVTITTDGFNVPARLLPDPDVNLP